jgi:hypothetical protein
LLIGDATLAHPLDPQGHRFTNSAVSQSEDRNQQVTSGMPTALRWLCISQARHSFFAPTVPLRSLMELRFQDPIFHGKEFTLKFMRSGKVLAKLDTGTCHYTLHPGNSTGSLDLHKTDESLPAHDPAKYETLAVLPHRVLIEQLTVIAYPMLAELCGLWRPLRLGWMIRRQLAIGPRMPTDSNFPNVSAIKLREGPSDPNDPLATWMKPPEFYDEILHQPNTAYLLYDSRKRSPFPCGVVVTYAGSERHVRMLWAKTRDLNEWSRRWEPSLLAIWNLAQENSNVPPVVR